MRQSSDLGWLQILRRMPFGRKFKGACCFDKFDPYIRGVEILA